MTGRSFLDTNVLVYADDHDTPNKRSIAQRLIENSRLERSGVVSTQVLQEYFVAVTRKLGVLPSIARRKVELLGRLDLVVLELNQILGAIDLHRLHTLSFWDALIVQAASDSGCSRIYSEDMQAGRRIAGLEIVNPFQDVTAPGT